MPKYTPNLNIQLADPATDGNQTFNIETMINDPVEKLDEALGMVPVSGDVRAATTGNIVLSGAQTIDGIALAAGNRVLVKNQTAGKENGIYTVSTGAWTRTVDANSTAKLVAGIGVYVEEGAANGKTQWQMTNTGAVTLDTTAITFERTGGPASATDTIIGSRTVSDATAPTGDSGTVTTLFGWLANMVKAITGGATWRTLPGMSIAAIKTVLDAATNLGTASTLMKRDANGRAQVAAPSAAADIARKDTVDGAVTVHKAETDPHTGYVKKSGDTMSGILSTPFGMNLVAGAVPPDNIGNIWANGSSGVLFYRDKAGYRSIPLCTEFDLTYYVRADGNDTNAGTANTAAGAFGTMAKAISMIPTIVNHVVTIMVGTGTFDAINITSKHGSGYISISMEDGLTAGRSFASVNIVACTCKVMLHNIKARLATATPFVIDRCNQVELWYCASTVAETTATQGIMFYNSKGSVVGCEISNRTTAMLAHASSMVNVDGGIGTGLRDRFIAQYNSLISHYNSGTGGTVSFASTSGDGTWNGGVIQGGLGVINPWGDNNRNQRTGIHAYKSTDQGVEANTSTKVFFPNEYFDFLGEYSNSRFTAAGTGQYLINVALWVNSQTSTGVRTHIAVYRNGAYSKSIVSTFLPVLGYSLMSGSLLLDLTAGEYIEIYFDSTTPVMITGSAGQATNYFIAQRVG